MRREVVAFRVMTQFNLPYLETTPTHVRLATEQAFCLQVSTAFMTYLAVAASGDGSQELENA
jgi:hypothetical protein